VLLSAELNRRMEELLHGDNRWLTGPASAVPPTTSVGGGITSEEEETEIQALNDWVNRTVCRAASSPTTSPIRSPVSSGPCSIWPGRADCRRS